MANNQIAKSFLREWRFYEKHFHEFHEFSPLRKNAVILFSELKQLPDKEIEMLIERYYKASEYVLYDEAFDDYRKCVPVPFDLIAKKYEKSSSGIQKQIKGIEHRLEIKIWDRINREKEASKIDIESKFGHLLKEDSKSKELFLEKSEELANTGELIKLPNGSFVRLSGIDTKEMK